ncbi:MAG: hypothetical protein DDT22_00774 [candidate division WS2 bacterium]|nr:hypothetical protein [Candidatus Lithacetigena glycinireducens]
MDKDIFNSLIPVFTESISGIALDLTTVAVGIFAVILVILGIDLIIRILFVSPKSEFSDDKGDLRDREAEYNRYTRERYWRELYRNRYERSRYV